MMSPPSPKGWWNTEILNIIEHFLSLSLVKDSTSEALGEAPSPLSNMFGYAPVPYNRSTVQNVPPVALRRAKVAKKQKLTNHDEGGCVMPNRRRTNPLGALRADTLKTKNFGHLNFGRFNFGQKIALISDFRTNISDKMNFEVEFRTNLKFS